MSTTKDAKKGARKRPVKTGAVVVEGRRNRKKAGEETALRSVRTRAGATSSRAPRKSRAKKAEAVPEEAAAVKTRRPRARRAERMTVEPQAVVKPDYIQLIVNNEPFVLEGSHPTFSQLHEALTRKDWKRVPKLVTLAAALADASAGEVKVKQGRIYYHGEQMDSSMARDILAMMQKGADVQPQLNFMSKLYKNPSAQARAEFWDWRRDNGLPIADDGDILAYKSVDEELMDEYTHSISNHPGAVISGPRKWFDNDYRRQCASGYHVCSKRYGVYGARVMLVKINPADVLSAPDGGKMRVRRYEVLKELTDIPRDDHEARELFKSRGVAGVEGRLVMEVARERKEMVAMLLADPQVKRLIRRKKLGRATVQRGTFACLSKMLRRFGLDTTTTTADTGEPELRQARKAAGFSVKQVADALGVSLRTVYNMELRDPANPEETARYTAALEHLKGARVKTELRLLREESGLKLEQVAEAMGAELKVLKTLEAQRDPDPGSRDRFLLTVALLKGISGSAGSALVYTNPAAGQGAAV
jgi:DNA-binding transcriptional regulator YiaG